MALCLEMRKAAKPVHEVDTAVNKRIRVPKTSEIVADQIRGQIIRGERNEGDFLPPEGQLMETLGISRPTLREAFRILEAEGLIGVVRGSRTGARVYKPSVELVSRYAGYVLQSIGTTISDLYQARLAIEPSVVRWLATTRGDGALGGLHNIVAEMRALLDSEQHDAFVELVEAFHQELVRASGLKTLTFMNRILLNLAATHQRDLHRRNQTRIREDIPKFMRTALKSFEKLLSLIEEGDIEGAVAHWRGHLRDANTTLTKDGEGDRVVNALGG